jgi:hypothetical protein
VLAVTSSAQKVGLPRAVHIISAQYAFSHPFEYLKQQAACCCVSYHQLLRAEAAAPTCVQAGVSAAHALSELVSGTVHGL